MDADRAGEHLRQTLLEAMVELAGRNGYADTAVADVIAAAGVGRSTFYRFFANREECYLAAYDMVVEQIADQLRVVDRVAADLVQASEGGWPKRVQAALRSLVEAVEQDPTLSSFLLIEPNAVGASAQARYAAALERAGQALENSAPPPAGGGILPPATATMAIGGAMRVLMDGLRQQLPVAKVAPDVFFALLMPYLGVDEAAAERKRAYG